MRPSRRRDAPRSGKIGTPESMIEGPRAAPATAAGPGSLEAHFECGPALAVLRRESPPAARGSRS
eukprot:6765522-Alexandrium_andersonii.AAC.1